jgi:lactoylglutathione lyase
MHLGSVYLIVNDFRKSIAFYEKLLQMPVTSENKDRFAQFVFEGHNISILNGHFDTEYPDKIIRKGECVAIYDDIEHRALAPNTNKFVFNFWDEDLRAEYERVKGLNITGNISTIKYFHYVAPYYYFDLTDPDGNIIEVTGGYTPAEGEFE